MTNRKQIKILKKLFFCCTKGTDCCSCSQNFPQKDIMWCFNRNIVNLSEVVSLIPDNTTAINLSKNKIRVIPAGSFSRISGLKTLDLSQNELASLKGGEFKGLNLMDFLNLTSNNISHIHWSAFEGLSSLKTLLLARNTLTGPFSLFLNLPEIKVVDLSVNMLKSFSCKEYGGSSTLRSLNLSANNIQKVNVSCFPALNLIKLSNNTELELEPDAFASNLNLKFLFLQSVRVEVLMGLNAETKKTLTCVSFSLFAEKSPWTICDVLRVMDNLSEVQVLVLVV
uniref:Uncharacterized protein n=1 Tax=Kryptolebias marmoratus TaxID=37003 RepID=A0A3Q3ALU3_KRYMA